MTMKTSLIILLTILSLVQSKSKIVDSDDRQGRQMPQGFPSMMPTTGNPSNTPISGDLGLPTLPNFNNLGLSTNQVPSSIRNMQPGSDSFNNMFQKMFSSNLLSNGGNNPFSNMFGSMGGLPSMSGLPSMGGLSSMGGLPNMGGLPGMGSGFPGMGGGFPDMMGGGDMFSNLFGSPTVAPTTTSTTTTTTTTAAPVDPFGNNMFGGSMGMGLPFGGGMPSLGSMGLPSFGNMGFPNFNFNSMPSLPGLPQLSNPSNGSGNFQNFANIVPVFGAFSNQLGRSDDEDVAKLQSISCRIGTAFKVAENESSEACQRAEICHGIKEAHDFGAVGVTSSKPLCVAGCKMLSNSNKMKFEPCFKTIVQSEMKESCEVIFPGCERDDKYWVALNNNCQEQMKAENEKKRKLSQNKYNVTHHKENAENEEVIREPEEIEREPEEAYKEPITTTRSYNEKREM